MQAEARNHALAVTALKEQLQEHDEARSAAEKRVADITAQWNSDEANKDECIAMLEATIASVKLEFEEA